MSLTETVYIFFYLEQLLDAYRPIKKIQQKDIWSGALGWKKKKKERNLVFKEGYQLQRKQWRGQNEMRNSTDL